MEQDQFEFMEQEFGGELSQWVDYKNSINQMLGTKGWQLFEGLLQTQLDQRAKLIAAPPEEVKSEARTFLAGEMSGLTIAKDVLGALLSTAEDMIELINSRQEEEEEIEEEEEADAT